MQSEPGRGAAVDGERLLCLPPPRTQTHLQPKRRARIPARTETRIGNLLPFASNSVFVRLFLKRKPTQMRKADFAQIEVREEDECACTGPHCSDARAAF